MENEKLLEQYQSFKLNELKRIKSALPDDEYKLHREVIIIGGIHGIESSSTIEMVDKLFNRCFNQLYTFKLLY